MLKRTRRWFTAAVFALAILWAGAGDYRPTPFDLAVSPYRYDLLRWEASNLLDKWVNKLGDVLPWTSTSSRDQRIADAKEYFDLGERIRESQQVIADGRRNALERSQTGDTASLRNLIDQWTARRDLLRGGVEETLESEISAVLSGEGFNSAVGIVFPPVDTIFTRSPGVLVLSPRDRIFRMSSELLRPGIGDEDRTELEEMVFNERGLAALVEDTGGVAAYPSVVSDTGTLHQALVTTAHEWLHHWFFFQPLGQHYWDSPYMTPLNETAATLGGRAIGDLALTAMTGEVVERDDPPPESESDEGAAVGPVAFDFNAAMRETRLVTDELLAEGKIEQAETYMEERRLLINENGFRIRKINQAYFAFHGSYATSAASISPIDGQLREIQARSLSLADFIKTVGRFDSYDEFLAQLEG